VAAAWFRPLVDPDEGRYGEAAREMLVSGDWLIPRQGEVPYPDKPPGVYWLMALGMNLAGPGPLPLRLPSLVSLGLLLLWIRRRGARGPAPGTGSTAALIAASCPLFLALGQLATLDMTLTLCTTAAILSGRDWLEGGGRGTGLLAGLALGAGFLVKGPVAWMIPLAVLAATALWERRPARLLRLLHPLLLLPMLAVGLSWYLAAASAEPDFLSYWWNREFLGRIASDVHSRARPFWYFPALAAAVLLPWWSIPACNRLFHPAQDPNRTGSHPDRTLFAVWGLLPILLFSIPPGKQPGYLAPAVPGLALGLACWWNEERRAHLRNRLGLALLVLEAGLMTWFCLPAHARSDDVFAETLEQAGAASWKGGQLMGWSYGLEFRLGRSDLVACGPLPPAWTFALETGRLQPIRGREVRYGKALEILAGRAPAFLLLHQLAVEPGILDDFAARAAAGGQEIWLWKKERGRALFANRPRHPGDAPFRPPG